MTLHILNLITPLTPSRHTSPANADLNGQINIRKVDITAPGLRSALNALVEASAADLRGERDFFVKVSPPIHIKVVVPSSSPSAGRSSSPSYFPSPHNPTHQRSTSIFSLILPSTLHSKSTSELLDSFMSSWTRLVGDPILSKWIVVVLAISISLNGYLLKGIASGVVGGRFAESLGVGFGRGVVRFEEVEEDSGVDREEEEGQIVVIPPDMDVEPKVERHSSSETTRNVASFKMEEVDRKLQTASRLMIKPKAVIAPVLPLDQPRTTIVSTTTVVQATLPLPSFSSPDVSPAYSGNKLGPIRSLDECIDIFENGPRPLSDSLALLNDEEIILLSQKGKVAAYALEKVLGPTELERAVRIRRALICTVYSLLLFAEFQIN